MSRMVIAPHADDETLGAGGYLAKFPDAVVVLVCGPDEDREAEFWQAMKALGAARNVIELKFPDGEAGAEPSVLTQALDSALCSATPGELLIPAPGTHQDHVAVYEASMRAARLSMNRQHWSPPVVLVYDVPAYDLQLYPSDLRWNVFERLDVVHVQRKANAMRCYGSQVPTDDHPGANGSVVAAARMVGAAVGVPFAEKYSAVRLVRP